MTYQTLIVEQKQHVCLITFNRPKVLNALSSAVMAELGQALRAAEAQPDVGSIVLTGNEKAFAAGADIAEMQPKTATEAYLEDFITNGWECISQCRKPVIAAVAGYALGGGCEVAMMCDMIIAADSARFGQPEITLGIIPGAGGTQRLTRAVGKAKAMDMILTGRLINAQEALADGLVSRVVPAAELLSQTLEIAEKIAGLSQPAVLMAKEAVNKAEEVNLSEGVKFERRLFHSIFASPDQKEGMAAFMEKRQPQFAYKAGVADNTETRKSA